MKVEVYSAYLHVGVIQEELLDIHWKIWKKLLQVLPCLCGKIFLDDAKFDEHIRQNPNHYLEAKNDEPAKEVGIIILHETITNQSCITEGVKMGCF